MPFVCSSGQQPGYSNNLLLFQQSVAKITLILYHPNRKRQLFCLMWTSLSFRYSTERFSFLFTFCFIFKVFMNSPPFGSSVAWPKKKANLPAGRQEKSTAGVPIIDFVGFALQILTNLISGLTLHSLIFLRAFAIGFGPQRRIFSKRIYPIPSNINN